MTLLSRALLESPPTAADGVFGEALAKAVHKLQAEHALVPDGVVDQLTLRAIDARQSRNSTALPLGKVVPRAPRESVGYTLGALDPVLARDNGAGPWRSKRVEGSYIALKLALIEALPAAAVMVGPDAAAHLAHYLGGSGRTYTVDLAGMLNDVASAKEHYADEVWQARRYAETLPVGAHAITSRRVEHGYNFERENRNWFFALGGYARWGVGQVLVTQKGGARSYSLDLTYKLHDRYNWDGDKAVTVYGIQISDRFMGEFHRQGLAREFDCTGSYRRRFTWKHGEALPFEQLFTAGTYERGAA